MNKGVDVLSRRYLLLFTLESKVLGFESAKEMYDRDEDFKEIYKKCFVYAHGLFYKDNGFLFKGNRLCIPSVGLGNSWFKSSMDEP